MSDTLLDPKITDEVIYLDMDFSPLFDTAVTITDVTVTVTTYQGVDASPSNILEGTPNISGKIASQLIKAGISGVTYLITFKATGDDSTINDIQVLLPVVSTRIG